ncbi:hypothetical protein R1sor_021934 [Riccia sorocarpa]|uniref:C-terminal of Roc (COR) domain-containing protein n=1 Tax=Riccia sorocarpa TaxID=122646 RepID=A0ABD3GIF6_9MARC
MTSSASSTSAYFSELVTGLKQNPHPLIQEISVVSLKKSTDTIFISEIIRRTTKLQKLRFEECELDGLSEDTAGSLASSILEVVQLNLDELAFEYCGDTTGVFQLVRKIFAAETDLRRRYLRKFSFAGADGFPEKCWGLFPVLAGNVSATSIRIRRHHKLPSSISWWKAFADALKSSPVLSTVIKIEYGVDSCDITVEAKRHSTGSLTVVQTSCSSVADLKYINSVFRQDYQIEFLQQLFADNLRSSSSIAELAFRPRWDFSFSERWWKGVFQSLKSNTSVTSLDLSGCSLTDVDFEHLRNLLRVNYTIEEVKLLNTPWRKNGKAALIEEALIRNKKAAAEFSILKGAGFEFGRAKVGRIFMCGSPYAGKTQLKLRMLKLRHKRSSSASKPGKFSDAILEPMKRLKLRRTTGAEVEVLMNERKGQVSVWDLAGQYMFRALHDLILPRTNQSLAFVFAFNPFQGDSKKNMKENVYDAFAQELEEWLKFVASSCQTGGDSEHLPQVLVVITHRDLTNKYARSFECGPESPVQEIMERLETIFNGVVNLVSKVYHVDSREKKDVRPFLDDILALMNNWTRVHLVPFVCTDISSALLGHAKSFNTSPVWSLSTFYRFCHVTIASYLHDVGRIIIVPKCSGSKNDEPLLIVDPNWCTETFLGTMIAAGNHFEVHGESRSGNTMIPASSDGFISERRFQSLLQQTLRRMKGEGVEATLLQDLLQRLNLCYRFEDGVSGANSGASVRYFVPLICGGLEEKCDLRRELKWEDGQTEGCEYLGYRLHCRDPRTTSFNKGVFSRFQIKFRQKLMKRFGMDESDRGISCGLGLLRVMYDGYEVLVESDEVNGQHVDIMVKSSQPGVQNPRTRIEVPDGELELVKDTLGPEDLTDILLYVRGKVMTSKREVQTCSNELQQMVTKLSGESIISAGKLSLKGRGADFSQLTMEEEVGTSRGGASHSVAGEDDNLQISGDLKPLADLFEAKFDQFGMKLERKIDGLAELMMAELQQLKIEMKEMQKVMTDVSSRIDKLIGYSISREDHSCPRRPYFTTKDAGLLPKGKAYVLRGQAVRLHFLCEAKNGPHVVQDQPGLPLVITEREMSWAPFLSDISLKLISTLSSVGIPLISGIQIDTQVLNFANLNTGERLPMSNELLKYMKGDSSIISVDPADPRVMQSWSLLQRHMIISS